MTLLCRNSRMLLPMLLAALLSACGSSGSAGPGSPAATEAPAGISDGLWQEMLTELERTRQEAGRDRNVSMAPRELGNRVSQIGTEDSGDGGVNVGWYYRNNGDYDLNGLVNISDLTPVGIGFKATAADPAWFSKGVADGDANGEVNLADITPIGIHFGNAVTGYIVEHTTTPQFLGSYTPVGEILLGDGTVISSKVTSDITLPTEIRQIYFEVKIDAVNVADSFGIRPYYEVNGKRELGIASYETKPPGQSIGWPQSGGNTEHTGQSDTYFSTQPSIKRNLGGLIDAYSCNPAYDDNDNYYLGTADGRLIKYNDSGARLWETTLGWRINSLEYVDSEFGIMAMHDAGISFIDTAGALLESQAVGRVLSRPVVFFEDASYRGIAGISWDGKLFSLHLLKGTGVELAWEQDLGGRGSGNVVTSGLRLFTVVKGLDGADDRIVSADFAGLDMLTHETAAGIAPQLSSAADGRIWANIGGTHLQAYNPDGSASDMAMPASGSIGPFIADSADARLWITVDDAGSWSLLDWDSGTNSETDNQSLGGPVASIIDTGEHLALALEDGTVSSLDNMMDERWSVDLTESRFPGNHPRLDFAAQIGTDGRLNVIISPMLTGLDYDDGTAMVSRGDSLNEARLNITFLDGHVQLLDRLLSGVEGSLAEGSLSEPQLGGPLDDVDVIATSSTITRIPLSPTESRTRFGLSFRTKRPAMDPFRLTDSVRSSSDTAFGCGYAMYEDDGSIAWDEFFDNEELGAPSFSFRRLIMNSTDTAMNTHRVFCLTEATGAELWSKDLASPGASVPVADDDAQAYVITEAGMLHKLNEQGQDVWSEMHEEPSTGLVLYDDTLFFGAGDSIEAVDISDGSLLYSQGVPDGIEATPVVSSTGTLQFVTLAGDLMEMDVLGADQTPVLLFDGEGAAYAQPIADGSGLTAWITDDGIVHCCDGGGNLVWEIDSFSPARSELSVDLDGNLYAVDEFGRVAVIGL